jgi:hypothetical protein
LFLSDGDRSDSRTRAALDLQRLHDERKLVGTRRGELIQLQVLEQEDAVHDQRDLMDRQIELLDVLSRVASVTFLQERQIAETWHTVHSMLEEIFLPQLLLPTLRL